MESVPSNETVHQAIQALYHDQNPANNKSASLWLQQLQRSVYAWKVADSLLHEKRDLESCYFAAQTMRSKIQYSFHELPVDAHASLRDSLLEHLACVTAETSQVIVTQLCLSVADMALLMQSWQQPVEQLLAQLAAADSCSCCLLQVLTVLPEEVDSRHLRLGANRRQQMSAYCTDICPLVLKYLSGRVAGAGDVLTQSRVLKCLGSWFSFPSDSLVELAESHLLRLAFHVLQNSQVCDSLHEVAADCVCAALLLVDEDAKFRRLADALFAGVFTLTDAYQLAVASEMNEKCRNFSRVFTELGEAVVSVLVHNQQHALGSLHVLDAILMCVGHHDYEVAEVTFHFWYRLSEELWQLKNSDRIAIYRPYFERLLVALCRHCQMDVDHEGTVDEHTEFGEFRERVCDLVRDCVFVCGSLRVFTQLFTQLQHPGVGWPSQEASLLIMAAVAANIVPADESVVPDVLRVTLQLDASCHVALRHSALQLLGGLADWLSRRVQLLEPVLHFVVGGLHVRCLSSAAAVSLRHLCVSCCDVLAPHAAGLLQIVQALDSLHVTSSAAVDLLQATAKVVTQTCSETSATTFSLMCQVQLTALQKLTESSAEGAVSHMAAADPVVYLDRLAALFKHTCLALSEPSCSSHPCRPAALQSWPVVAGVLRSYQSSIRVVERGCRCVRFMVRCVGSQLVCLLPVMCQLIVEAFTAHQHSCLIYLASVLVDEYGGASECVAPLMSLLDALLPRVLPTLSASVEALRNSPEVVDDLLRLCTRLLQRLPLNFLQHASCRPVVQLAVTALTLDHRDANASVTRFLSELLRCGRRGEDRADFGVRRQLALSLLQATGSVLVANVIQAALFCVASFMVPDLGELLMEAMLLDRPAVCQWLELTLNSLPTQTVGGVVTVTHKQLAEFHKALTSAEDCNAAVHALREFSRLYR